MEPGSKANPLLLQRRVRTPGPEAPAQEQVDCWLYDLCPWDLSLLTGAQAHSLARLANSKGGVGFWGSRFGPREAASQHGGLRSPMWRCLNCPRQETWLVCSHKSWVQSVKKEVTKKTLKDIFEKMT